MELIDLFSGFKEYYVNDVKGKELQDLWFKYMENHKYVRDLCINDYKLDNLDWEKVTIERVFQYDNKFYDKMEETNELLLETCNNIQKKLNSFYKMKRDDSVIVLYHGLGNGAGWMSEFFGRAAIYLGIEKIVELGWNIRSKLEDLVAHEYGHLVHMEVRGEPLSPYKDFHREMIFKMYTEGVATYCERIFNGREKSSKEWYENCIINEEKLKNEFLDRFNSKDPKCMEFFGDWNPVFGISEAGYFLGERVIANLIEKYALREIMKMNYNTVEIHFLSYLANLNVTKVNE